MADVQLADDHGFDNREVSLDKVQPLEEQAPPNLESSNCSNRVNDSEMGLNSARPLILSMKNPEVVNQDNLLITQSRTNAGFCRVMRLYEPKWLVFFSLVFSLLTSLTYPLFGYISSELIYHVMSDEYGSATFRSDRDTWCMYFLYLCIGSGFFGFL